MIGTRVKTYLRVSIAFKHTIWSLLTWKSRSFCLKTYANRSNGSGYVAVILTLSTHAGVLSCLIFGTHDHLFVLYFE